MAEDARPKRPLAASEPPSTSEEPAVFDRFATAVARTLAHQKEVDPAQSIPPEPSSAVNKEATAPQATFPGAENEPSNAPVATALLPSTSHGPALPAAASEPLDLTVDEHGIQFRARTDAAEANVRALEKFLSEEREKAQLLARNLASAHSEIETLRRDLIAQTEPREAARSECSHVRKAFEQEREKAQLLAAVLCEVAAKLRESGE